MANPTADDAYTLAQAFARDELDHEGQQRLYDLLRQPGEAGRAHARAAWQALAMDTDLRAQLGRAALTDAVRLRLDDGGGFLRSVMQRLGWSRPQLQPVGLPSIPPRPRSRAWLLLPMALCGLLVLWWLTMSRPLVQVIDNSGSSRFNAAPLPVGTQLQEWIGDGILVVSGGVRLRLAIAGSGMVTIDGPAQGNIVGRRLALSQGLIRLESSLGEMEIGLPDGSLRVPTQTHLTLRVDQGQSAIAVAQGEAQLTSDAGARILIEANRAYHHGQTFAWQGSAREHPTGGDSWLGDEVAPVVQWQLSLRWQPAASTDAVRMVDRDTTAEALVIATDHVRQGNRRWDLTGPPLTERSLRLERWAGRTLLNINGLSAPIALDFTTMPELQGAGLDIDFWHSGPSLPTRGE